MHHHRLALAALAAVLLVGALTWYVVGPLSGPRDTAGPVAGSPGSPGSHGSPGASGTPSGRAGPGPSSTAPSPQASPKSSTHAPARSTRGRQPGAEVLPTPAAEVSAGAYRLPGLAAPSAKAGTPLVTAPRAGTARGALVATFPAALAPPAGSTIRSSSLSVSGTAVQAALVARSAASVSRTLRQYRTALVARGFREQRAQGVENHPAAAFVRGHESVSLAFSGRTLSLLATLRTA